MTMFRRRVVVTGLGVVSPIGNDVGAFWSSLLDGRSGAAPIAAFPVGGAAPAYAAEVKGFTPESAGLPRKRVKMMGRQAQLAFAAASAASLDAALPGGGVLATRLGMLLGVGMLNADVDEFGRAFHAASVAAGADFDEVAFGRSGAPALFPLWLLRHIPNLAAAHAAIALDAQGPSNTIATGCVAAANAIGEAARIIGRGEADVILAGGTDARVSPLATIRYRDLGWLATREDADPAMVSAPFDEAAAGFVNGEGAGVVVLEALEHARARGAHVHAEVAGYAAANDACGMLTPDRAGAALHQAISRCLDRADIAPGAVDVVFAPAPSVAPFDRATAAALALAFGGSQAPAVTATRSLLGHTHAASSALDCVAAVKSIADSRIPATANLRRPIATLPFVTGAARHAAIRTALVGAYGFGGHAAALALRGYDQ
jgi:3-oxoacyl-[acyl-carrier-protein] synthase II